MMNAVSEDHEDLEAHQLVARPAGQASWTGRSFLTVEWDSTELWNLDMVLADIIAMASRSSVKLTRQYLTG
jgi:hypothetical protein